ncbi:MAG: hypothetical protein ACRDBY_14380 [Cetobacterium sp.]
MRNEEIKERNLKEYEERQEKIKVELAMDKLIEEEDDGTGCATILLLSLIFWFIVYKIITYLI